MNSILKDSDIEFLKDNETIYIEEDKIHFCYESFIHTLAYGLITVALMIIPQFIYFCYFKNLNIFIVIITVIFSAEVSPFLTFSLFRFHRVIDFKNKSFYNKSYFFFIPITFKFYYKNDVLKVCNNIITQELDPNPDSRELHRQGKYVFYKKAEKHKDTNLYHGYFLSFFLKNGYLYNFLPLGYTKEDYENSLKLAKLLSTYWNIDFVECPENNTLKEYSLNENKTYLKYSDTNSLEYSNIQDLQKCDKDIKAKKIEHNQDDNNFFYGLIYFGIIFLLLYLATH